MACVIPASVAGAWLVYHSYTLERQQLIDGSINTARALTQVLDRDVVGAETALQALATSPSLSSGDFSAFYGQAKGFLANQVGNNIVVTDRTGQQLFNTLVPYGTKLPNRPSPQFKKVLSTGQPLISDLFVSGVSNRQVVAVEVPVIQGGEVAYVLSMGILTEGLGDILARQHIPPNEIAGISDSSNTLVARNRDAARFVGRPPSAAFHKRLASSDEGYFESQSLDGTPVISAYSRSPITDWRVAISIPRSFLRNQLWHSLAWLLVVLFLLVLFSLSLTWRIGGRIARSISGLIKPAVALGYGQAVTVPPFYLREAREVGAALVKASSMLQEARHQAHHDALTGLANRALFNEMVQQQLALCERTNASMAILYIDLDGFKTVNDTYGHAAGDELLRQVAARLKAGVRASDVVARLGGDEFAAVLVHSRIEEAAEVAGKLIGVISAPYQIGPVEAAVSASIGVSAYPQTAATGPALMKSADDAMYEAKASGKGCFIIAEIVDETEAS